MPRLKKLGLSDSWFAPIDAQVADLAQLDYAALVEGCERVFCFWDVHTYDIADVLLGKLMPLIAKRPHVIAVHDISDNRYNRGSREYGGKSLWRGTDDFYANQEITAFANVLWLNFVNDMVVPLLDFCWRNGIELHSVDHEVRGCLRADAGLDTRLKAEIPAEFLNDPFHFAYFTLNEGHEHFTFPSISSKRRRAPSTTVGVLLSRLRRLLS